MRVGVVGAIVLACTTLWLSDVVSWQKDFEKDRTLPEWRNWAGNVRCLPHVYATPETESEIVELVKYSLPPIKVVGAGHSFSPVAASNGTLISLDRFARVLRVDKDRRQVEVQAGIRLVELSRVLHEHGLALGVLGAIDVQSVAGAISTGTHGSSVAYGSLASLVVSMRLVRGNGEIEVVEQSSELYKSAGIGVGVMGVILSLVLQCEEAFVLHKTFHPTMPMEEYLNNITAWATKYDFSMVNWLPYSGKVQPITMRKIAGTADSADSVFSRGLRRTKQLLFFSSLKLQAKIPWLARGIQSLLTEIYTAPSEDTAPSYRGFLIPCPGHYSTDTEYMVPLEKTAAVYARIVSRLEREGYLLNAFFVMRFFKEEEFHMSACPMGKKICSAMSFYLLFQTEPNHQFMASIEEEIIAAGGLFHLGKMTALSPERFRDHFRNWPQFVAHQRLIDPDGKFLNPHTASLFR